MGCFGMVTPFESRCLPLGKVAWGFECEGVAKVGRYFRESVIRDEMGIWSGIWISSVWAFRES